MYVTKKTPLLMLLSIYSFLPMQYLKERFKIDMPHRFKKYTFLGPTFCDMCGQLMHGIFRQQLKCEGIIIHMLVTFIYTHVMKIFLLCVCVLFMSKIRYKRVLHLDFLFTLNAACGTNCHARCAPNMPPLCGVNEKLLSEALKNVDQIKKNRRLVSISTKQYYIAHTAAA